MPPREPPNDDPRPAAHSRSRTAFARWAFAIVVMGCLGNASRASAEEPTPAAAMPAESQPAENASEASTGEADTEKDEEEKDEEFIETDRNSFTFSRYTAGANRLIVESSYSYINLGGAAVKNSFPESVLRYGIGDRFELRLGWNYETGPDRLRNGGSIAGFFAANFQQQVYYGFKAALTRQNGWMPGSAFFLQGNTPTGGPQAVGELRAGYVLGWTSPNRWTFDTGFRFGTEKNETSSDVLWAPSAVLKIPLTATNRWFIHIEYFSDITVGSKSDSVINFVDFGLHHLINPNLEVGAIFAFGPNDERLIFVTNVGVGVRF